MDTRITHSLFYILSVFLSSTVLSGILVAESSAANEEGPKLSLCDGVWTTKSCEKPEKSLIGTDKPVREKVVEEKIEPEKTEDDKNQDSESEEGSNDDEGDEDQNEEEAKIDSQSNVGKSVKLKPIDAQPEPDAKVIASILHPLNMKVVSIREQFEKDFDISQVQRYCESASVVIEECETKVSDSLEKARAYEVKLKELALEEKQLETELAKNQSKVEQNTVTITQVTSTNVKTKNINKHGLKKTHPGLGKHKDIIVSRPAKEVKKKVGASIDQSAVLDQ